MSATVAVQMFSADVLKLRKKLGTVAFGMLFACGPIVIFFLVRALQHSSNPLAHGPAGGVEGFNDGLRLLSLFMGPLAAILIGAEGGAGDSAAGVFRDLVVTGRSRLALFATRVPAAIAVCWGVILAGYALLLIGTFAFASGGPTPGGGVLLEGLAFSLLATGVVCAVAVGIASLTTSKPAAITALIGWQLVASPLIAQIDSLGSSRQAILSQALRHFSPTRLGDGPGVSMPGGTGVLVIVLWLVVFLALGAWRTVKIDA